jgi:uncharacterized membrane protein YcaP (DUF421 family)
MEAVLRVVVIYLIIVIALRLLGKREFGQLSPLELVTLLLIPEIVSNAIQGDHFSLTHSVVGVATLCVLVFATSLLSARSRRFQTLIDGEPRVLVHDGKLIPQSLMAERVTPEEVMSEMRKAGFDELEQIRWAILESDGKISVVPKGAAARRAPQQTRDADTGPG